jgi:hypothetical protein
MLFNDRRTIKNPAVAAAAKSGAIKAMPKNETEKVFKVNRPMTRLLAGKGNGTLIGHDVNVKSGSKKATKLQARYADYSKGK